MNRKLYVAACASLMLAACAGAAVSSLPYQNTNPNEWQAQTASTRTVGLGIGGSVLAEGVSFAGGVQLLTPTVSPLHSLSDLKLVGDGEFVIVSDQGDLVRGRLRLDENGDLAGLDQFRSQRLTRTDGTRFSDKAEADAEGLAVLPNGDLLVSFEGDHRIWNYGPLEALQNPKAMPRPLFDFKGNSGLEALASFDQNLWRVAGEDGGVWDCDAVTCAVIRVPPVEALKDSDFRTTGMDRDPSGNRYWVVQRRFVPPLDARARVRRMNMDGSLGPVLIELKLPGTTDNFEGIAVETRDDKTRLYILSDDNENPLQRTLMLAFDVSR